MARPAKLLGLAGVFFGMLVAASPAGAAPAVDGFFPVQGLEINNKIVAGPDGNMWVTLAVGKDVARITPAGQVQEFELTEVEGAQGIAVGPDGNLWVPGTNKVTKFSPGDPEGTDQTFTVLSINSGGQIVAGPDGLMWVASNNSLVHFNVADPPGTALPVTVNGALAPKDIDVAGSLIAIADTGEPRIATFTTAGAQQDFTLAGGSQGLAGGAGGQIGFSQPSVQPEEIGVVNPPSPAQGSQIAGDPFGVAFGSDGAYWIARSASDEVIRMTSDGQYTSLGGFPPKYFPRQVAAGPDNTIWVTAESPGENTAGVARVSGLEPPLTNPPPPPTAPHTKISKGPKKVVKTKRKKAKVKFRFSSPSPGAHFECSLTRLKGKRTKAAPLKGCKSPKVYRLRPGRYRFQVRAVLNGMPDPTPAARKFKVVHIR
jgi:hypothetical protein